jgi:hypothetical protein
MLEWCQKCNLQLTADDERRAGLCRFCLPPASGASDPGYLKQKRVVEKLQEIAAKGKPRADAAEALRGALESDE